MTQSIKLIAFDLFGVILTEGHLVSNVLMQLLPQGSQKKQVKLLYEKFNLGQLNEDEFWSRLGLTDSDKVRRIFLNSFHLDVDYKKVTESLNKNFRLAILSNLPPAWADELMIRFQFTQSFSPCLFSGHEGCKKPDPDIYQKLISQSRVPATHIAFIDDRLENLQSAHQLGFTTIYYHREDESHPYKADHTIRQLGELLTLFVE